MGYNTEFDGEFTLSRRLDKKTCNALEVLADSRHNDEIMPSIWCQWVVGENRRTIRWDGNEKFYGLEGLSKQLGVTRRTLQQDVKNLKSAGILDRSGPNYGGEWVVLLKW